MKFLQVFVLCFLLAGCTDSNIAAVQGGTFNFDNSITVQEALEGNQYFKNPAWSAKKDSQKRQLVLFKADIDLEKLMETIESPNAEQEILLSFFESKVTPENKEQVLDILKEKNCQIGVIFVINKDDSFDIADYSFLLDNKPISSAKDAYDAYDAMVDVYKNGIPVHSLYGVIWQMNKIVDNLK